VILEATEARPALEVVALDPDDLDDHVAAAVAEPLDGATTPPVRAGLAVLAPEEHVLVLTLHPGLVDERSTATIRDDLLHAYAARLRGRAPVWELVVAQPTDWALWRRDLLGAPDDPGSVVARQLAHWRDAMAGLSCVVPLPADRPRPARPDRRAGTVRLETAGLHGAVFAVARQHKATVPMVLTAGLAVLLSRLGAGSPIPIRVGFAGRFEAALDGAVGPFARTLPLLVDLAIGATFGELVGRVRAAVLAAEANGDVAFADIVPEPSGPAAPPFNVSLDVLTVQRAGPRLEAATVAEVPRPTHRRGSLLRVPPDSGRVGRAERARRRTAIRRCPV
jgi:hypothetical protein